MTGTACGLTITAFGRVRHTAAAGRSFDTTSKQKDVLF
jgi:hypothetical protein